jgi:hypothetical protein
MARANIRDNMQPNTEVANTEETGEPAAVVVTSAPANWWTSTASYSPLNLVMTLPIVILRF